MTLKNWFYKFQTRPLKITAVFLLLVWSIFAVRSYFTLESRQNTFTKQTADLLSLAILQKNRAGAESILESLVHQGEAVSAALCLGDRQELAVNENFEGCHKASKIFERHVEQNIQGSSDLVLKATFNILSGMSPMFSVLAVCLILVFMGFYQIQTAQSHMKKDLFDPIVNKLLGDEDLEIKELSDLRIKILEAKRTEAEKAVTLAIQENNEQVAHDIRSPIEAINELLKHVRIKDNDLKYAIKKALGRANAVANALLTKEKIQSIPIKTLTFDIVQVIKDLVSEKQNLFVGGKIEMTLPSQFFCKTQLTNEKLSRILSNVFDNAILACDRKKKIRLSLVEKDFSVEIEIVDTGRGIPKDLLKKIGQKGFSFREKSDPQGSGLGVYNAKQTLQEIGGSIKFESQKNQGTRVTIEIPIERHEMPSKTEKIDFVFIDNENLNHMAWEVASNESQHHGLYFYSIDEFMSHQAGILKSTPLFIDSDLGNGIRGENFASSLRQLGFTKLILATSYENKSSSLGGLDAIISKSFDEALVHLKPANEIPAEVGAVNC